MGPRTNSSASTGNNGAASGSGNQISADSETPVPAEPVVVTLTETPTPSTPTKEKSPSPEPSKPPAVVNTPVANTSSDDSKDASLVSISPTPIENYTTPRSTREVNASPLQPQIEKYAEETAAEEEEPIIMDDGVAPEEAAVAEPEREREPSVEPISLNETVEELVVETPVEEARPESELSDSLKQEELEKDEDVDEQELLEEENQPNGHIPSEIEEGELRDDDDDESTVADSGTDDQDDPTSAKGKIKYDRDTLLMIGSQHNYNNFKVAEHGLPDLAKDTLNNHHIKSHGPLMNKNSPGGPRDYGRGARGMPNQNKGPMMPPALSHMRSVMGPMQWGGGIMIPPPPPRVQPKVQLTLQREEVKLHKAENAWKPSTLKRGPHSHAAEPATGEEGIMVESIVKKTRGILNKLTPDNFDKLVNKFMELQLEDKDERISSVISVVFEKAIDEPSFSAAYAKMVHTVCKTSLETSKKFRKQILDQCQKEFQKSNSDEAEIKDVEQKLEEATDDESREQLKLELEEKKFTSRRRSLGNVRFIGELYKLQMLTPKIMVECVHLLLYSPDEENLECLCKLLATVGQKLDMQLKSLEDLAQRGDKPKFIPENKWMDRIFKQLETLSGNKKLSSRIRFAILDVVELRQNDWKPRRDTNAPKTIEEVRKEAYRQEMEEKRQINNLPPVQNNYGGGGDRDHRGGDRGGDRGGGGGGGGGGSRLPGNQPQKKGDWTTVSKASRFQTMGPKKTEPAGTGGTPIFGPPSFGGQWGQSKAQSGPPSGPSQPSRPQHEVPPRFLNRFQNLAVADDSSRSSNKGNQNSVETQGFRKQIPPMFPPQQQQAPPQLLPATSPPMSSNSSAANSRPVSPKDSSETFTADTSESVKNIFQEYLSCHKFDDTLHWIKTRFPGGKIDEFVEEMSRQVSEMSKEVEQKGAGMLLRLLIRNKEIPKETVIKLMAQGVMEDLPDIMIDVPKYVYLDLMVLDDCVSNSFLVEIFYEESNLDWLVKVGDRLIQNEDCGESGELPLTL
ncbi:Eukaryotic translation initiation factor 4 gamma 3 [Orchesella cincta]|uniref:Eukaryotic translation initiation factor 4 gamma 3 n=1 Tax=Orchesella cincta TaxID=48709 RepID=A0A1D2NDR0_ORCCI|nr:Eukaryotic translation initiation factor 4 gamma 3 [Orchesella cincta]